MGNVASYRRPSDPSNFKNVNITPPTTGVTFTDHTDPHTMSVPGLMKTPIIGDRSTLNDDLLHPQNFVRNRKDVMSMRSSKYSPKPVAPMPTTDELEKRFTKVLASMDLPPDKAKLLKQYDDHRKWEIVCDQELVQVRDPPRVYLRKLQTYLDPKASRSFKKRKVVGDSTSTQVLKDLEISLRTNNIEWVREFLNEENRGLEVLVDYLSFRLVMMRHEEKTGSNNNGDPDKINNTLNNGAVSLTISNGGSSNPNNGTMCSAKSSGGSPTTINKRQSRHLSKLNMGDAKDDIHVCILCLRAIMNNKHGLNMVIQKQESINAIALSLRHRSLRTKALVLELLAAVCLVQGGHQIILRAFDNFKDVCLEKRRFETLVDHFMHYESFHVEFMVACMQFINIVVHSVDDMNERVYLQYEFSQLGVDYYLDKLKNTQSEELKVQIGAYLDNVFDVAALMEDSETKSAALERVADLEEELSQLKEIYEKLEMDSLARIVDLEGRLNEVLDERDSLVTKQKEIDEEVSTLRRVVTEKEKEKNRMMEEFKSGGFVRNSSRIEEPDSTSILPPHISSNVVPPKPPPAPPAPPPMPKLGGGGPPPPPPPIFPGLGGPPPPPMMGGGKSQMTIKRAIQPKCKLPTLNWTVLKPREVKGTVFNQLDDSKYYNMIDFDQFERLFRIGNATENSHRNSDEADSENGLQSYPSKRIKRPEAVSLLEHTRLRNIAISRRKLDLPIETVVKAINALDLTVLKVEQVEVLQRMVPNEQESKLYREYIIARKNPELLTDEDKFLLQLSKVERISTKLAVMAYIANFADTANSIQPQIHSVIMSSRSVRTSEKFHQLLEIILAFGNYMNGAKRGPAYGFKIQSLECLTDTKSVDRRQCLMHYIVETVNTSFTQLQGFMNDLQFLEKASQVSLENVLSDLHDLEKGMELTKKEGEFLRHKNEPNPVMREFLGNSEDRLTKIKSECKTATNEFGDCVEFYGEERQQTDTSAFFSAILKFTRAYKQAETENETKKRLSMKNQSPPEKAKPGGKKQQEAVINELKKRQVADGNKKLQEVYHGALEDILSDLKNEPYRRADALRRSQRRKVDATRLSRNFEDLDV
ncbi:unnamed protein product [Allacma fusca]|uniref:Formin-like protein n=1 Tax=Allacma fusca TaxID=39272 RepID=A0A8J2NXL8_9HEXA|nr:unnamed protein product [Allacma fusca]